MIKELELVLSPHDASDESFYRQAIANQLHLATNDVTYIRLLKRSVDARKGKINVRLKAEIFINETPPDELKISRKNYPDVSRQPQVIIVGAGPAGLFAALALIENNLKPVIVERGKEVSARKLDIAKLNRNQIINPDSNYCFGEGGAGTFSDGKLYTRSTKHGNVEDILKTFVAHGASLEILYDAHPHIGSDKLPAIITAIRKTITDAGGEFHFNSRITGFDIKNNQIYGVSDANGNAYKSKNVILATGHSARDIFELFQHEKIYLEFKPFALGIRVEHPQALIDSIQYHSAGNHPYLPAATYQLVEQVDGRGVFSFCMCPGGIIVPAATDKEQVVVNGMSNSHRNSPFANAGIVVTVEEKDLMQYRTDEALAGLRFQEEVERTAFAGVVSGQIAPAQRMTDFTSRKISKSLATTSYHPGVCSAPLHELLPQGIVQRLAKAFREFDKKMHGFYTAEANLLAVESRTSSPVRILRDKESLQHVQIKGLYPCGEGAGYAGGIVSSAIDGIRCAMMITGERSL